MSLKNISFTKWHAYPEIRPTGDKRYAVTYIEKYNPLGSQKLDFVKYLLLTGRFSAYDQHSSSYRIIAWAEIKPYEQE